LAEVGWSK